LLARGARLIKLLSLFIFICGAEFWRKRKETHWPLLPDANSVWIKPGGFLFLEKFFIAAQTLPVGIPAEELVCDFGLAILLLLKTAVKVVVELKVFKLLRVFQC